MNPYQYRKETPLWLNATMIIGFTIALFPLINFILMGIVSLHIGRPRVMDLAELGQLGDFFGGHTSAFSGSISLVIVLFFTFHQAKQQHLFFSEQQAESKTSSERQFFLDGINLITQWDIQSPGCDQCMRLLDYYSRVALTSKDKELFLLLNTVITSKIRNNLEGKNGSFRATNYPYACEALEKIRPLRETDARAFKAEKAKSRSTLD